MAKIQGLNINQVQAAEQGLDREGIAKRANSLVPAMQRSTSTMPAAQTGPVSALPLQTTAATLPDTSASLVAGVKVGQKSLADYMNELKPPQTSLQDTQSALMKRVNELLPQTGGKGQALLDAEKQNQVPELNKKLNDLNALINTKVAEFEKEDSLFEQESAKQETRAIPMSIIRGAQGGNS